TGRLPFDGDTMCEILIKQVMQLPPPPRGLNPAIPPSVEQILLRCLAKPVDARFQSMPALREALLNPEAYLRASPPIAPTRSIRPGDAPVDAATMLMHAGAVQKAKLAGVPPPAPKTAAHAAYQAATMLADASGPIYARAGTGMPDLAQPSAPVQHTMRIATPLGYSARPPRRMWPIVLVMGLLLGLGGGAFAVAWFGRDEAPVPSVAVADGRVTTTTADASAPPSMDASVAIAVAAIDAATPAVTPVVTSAKVSIDSTPQGATVLGPDGVVLGKTPFKTAWPVGTHQVLFELRLPGYRKKTAPIVVDGNAAVLVELEKLPRSTVPKGSGVKPGSGSSGASDNALMRPD
ncbi:MAG TPA: PEGA domain-containing protein, partial [Kofleriaceae bacterium]|nr:PEGA domain-containing protein [Kofleriaceae bacterium]